VRHKSNIYQTSEADSNLYNASGTESVFYKVSEMDSNLYKAGGMQSVL
jgi:hypothetical protein